MFPKNYSARNVEKCKFFVFYKHQSIDQITCQIIILNIFGKLFGLFELCLYLQV